MAVRLVSLSLSLALFISERARKGGRTYTYVGIGIESDGRAVLEKLDPRTEGELVPPETRFVLCSSIHSADTCAIRATKGNREGIVPLARASQLKRDLSTESSKYFQILCFKKVSLSIRVRSVSAMK